ncbi:AraC family transcriptional regulator [Psychromonas ossibalaenae]|uniref:AraC family transcriptional regulator n=1 Tax=Psychromonas ossibalaenae TaxID=444922 RepID=UPI00036BAF0A|nr:AraC family transcriptional regulator [Psychromonas ossibalaenae]
MKNAPLLINRAIESCGITLRAMWDIYADKHYSINWPKDRKIPMVKNAVVAVYTIQGSGSIELKNGKKLILSGPSIIFLDCQQIKRYKTNGLFWELNWFEFMTNGVAHIPFEQQIFLTTEQYPQILNEIKEFIRSEDEIKRNTAVAGFGYLFYKWISLSKENQSMSSQEKIVSDVLAIMSTRIGENCKVTDFAQESGYTQQYLRKLFLKHVHLTPKQYYSKLKMDASLSMLTKRGYSVKRTAYELGFNDSFHFSRTFKSRFGTCPSQIEKDGTAEPKSDV